MCVLEASVVCVYDTLTVPKQPGCLPEGYFGMARVLWGVNIDATPSAGNRQIPELSISIQKHPRQNVSGQPLTGFNSSFFVLFFVD